MKRLVISLVGFMILTILFKDANAQDLPIKISIDRRMDNSVDFNYEKRTYGSWFISVELSNLRNAESNGCSTIICGNAGRLFTLKPKDPKQGIGFSYTYMYLQGKPNPNINEDVVYQLPFKKGTKINVNSLGYLGNEVGVAAPKTWKAFQFITEKEEVVVAVRRGLVIEVINEPLSETADDFSFFINEIIIEHKDGTLAKYSGFKAGSIRVKQGETVYPNSELGYAGKYDSENRCQIGLFLFYLNTRDLFNIKTDVERANQYGYLNPVFCYEGGKSVLLMNNNYVADCSDEIITQEFTKREKKKHFETF